jgi:FtsZ-interacting cell division protein ZipA
VISPEYILTLIATGALLVLALWPPRASTEQSKRDATLQRRMQQYVEHPRGKWTKCPHCGHEEPKTFGWNA